MVRSVRAKRWTWTLNDPTELETQNLEKLLEGSPAIAYMVYGKENAPSTGLVHFQGYVEFVKLTTIAKAKEILQSARFHLEVSKGTPQQNRTYCQKDGDWKEVGTMSAQGSRNDILRVQEMIKDGATDLEIADQYFGLWTRMRTAIQDYRRMLNPKKISVTYLMDSFPQSWREVKCEGTLVLWGVSGIGKTCFAKALLPNALLVSHIDDLKDYNGCDYDGIIFDDMDFNHIPRTAQIHLVDQDEDRSIHIRYGVASIPAHTKKIFTTNEVDGAIFTFDPAIQRRVKVIELEEFVH